jgi:hypothetical protein
VVHGRTVAHGPKAIMPSTPARIQANGVDGLRLALALTALVAFPSLTAWRPRRVATKNGKRLMSKPKVTS